MTVNKTGNTITIELDEDENETYDFMQSQSSILFQNYLIKLFRNRKKQQEFDLKRELTKTMTRSDIQRAIRNR